MRLAFPRNVEFRSPRLRMMYFTLMSVTLALLLAKFALANEAFEVISVGQYLEVNMWVEGHKNMANMEHVVNTNRDKVFCQDAASFAYQWDEQGDWLYGPYACRDLCTKELRTSNCLNSVETYLKEGVGQVLLITEMEDTLMPDEDGTDATEYHFITTTEALSVSFSYQFNMPVGGLDGVFGPSHQVLRSQVEVLTVIMSQDSSTGLKTVEYVLEPSRSIDLSVPELLRLAGNTELLDSLNTEAGRNWMDTDDGINEHDYPSTRITGVELILETECYNWHLHPLEAPYATWKNVDGNIAVCYLVVAAGSTTWVSAEATYPLDIGTQVMHRYYHGIRVRAHGGGEFHFVDGTSIFSGMVDIVVLMALPRQLMLFFMVTCLGHLSNIYRRALFQPFRLLSEVGGIAARLMGSGVQFVELEDASLEEHGISRNRMSERLKEVLSFHVGKIDETAMDQFVSLCYHAIQKHHNPISAYNIAAAAEKALHQQPKALMRKVKKLAQPVEYHSDGHINLEMYSSACASDDQLPAHIVVGLFEKDRKMPYLESVFMPPDVKDCINLARKGVRPKELLSQDQSGPESGTCQLPITELAIKSDTTSILATTSPNNGAGHAEPAVGLSAAAHSNLGARHAPLTLEDRRRAAEELPNIVANLAAREESRNAVCAEHGNRALALEARVGDLVGLIEAQASKLESLERRVEADAKKRTAEIAASVDEKVASAVADLGKRVKDLEDSLHKRAIPAIQKEGLLAGAAPQLEAGVDEGEQITAVATQIAESVSVNVKLSELSSQVTKNCEAIVAVREVLESRLVDLERSMIEAQRIEAASSSGSWLPHWKGGMKSPRGRMPSHSPRAGRASGRKPGASTEPSASTEETKTYTTELPDNAGWCAAARTPTLSRKVGSPLCLGRSAA